LKGPGSLGIAISDDIFTRSMISAAPITIAIAFIAKGRASTIATLELSAVIAFLLTSY